MQTQAIKTVEFERPQMDAGKSCTANAWARVPAALSAMEKAALKDRIRRLLKEKQAVLVAHYYVPPDRLWQTPGRARVTPPRPA